MNKIDFHPDVKSELQDAYNWYDGKISGLGEEFFFHLQLYIKLKIYIFMLLR